jgi:hypothetical protein
VGRRPGSRAARAALAVLALACAAGFGLEMYEATNFPTADPIRRVDAGVVAWLRAHPGTHRALAEDAVFEVALDLRDDPWNRWIYGTRVDLREAAPRRAIHVQRKGERGAIHADDYNPKAGSVSALLHGTIEVPVLPLAAGAVLGTAGALRRRRSPRRSAEEFTAS